MRFVNNIYQPIYHRKVKEKRSRRSYIAMLNFDEIEEEQARRHMYCDMHTSHNDMLRKKTVLPEIIQNRLQNLSPGDTPPPVP